MQDETGLLADVVDLLPMGVWIAKAPGGELAFANRTFHEIMGIEARSDVAAGGYSEPYGIFDRSGRPYPEDQLPFCQVLRRGTTLTVDDIVIHRPDGTRVAVRAQARPVRGPDGEIAYVVVAFADITAEVEAEERRGQSQRLEALGTLSAGIAHDFNNVLASISMIAAKLRLLEADPDRIDDLRQITAAVDSAAQLTRGLLAFGRSGSRRSQHFDAGSVVRSIAELARRTFDPSVELVFDERGNGLLLGDPAQIEQLCMNLVVNARDALPGGGRITVTVDAIDLEVPPRPLKPGRYVRIEVADTGEGIPQSVRHRIFEPYFTTKEDRDQPGTGLGLATVYGVAQAFGGLVEVTHLEPHGTSFEVLLPVCKVDRTAARPPRQSTVVPGSGSLLFAEDDPTLRRATRRSLEMMGYTVLEAKDGREAIEVFVRERAQIGAVLLDLVMPRLGGAEALLELRSLAPNLPVVMMSGRIAEEDGAKLIGMGATALLHKPYSATELSRMLHEAMEPR